MNWFVIIGLTIAALALILYLLQVNLKDKKEYEKQVNEDYKKTKDEEDELDPGE